MISHFIRRGLAQFVFKHRLWVFLLLLAMPAFIGWGISDVRLKTIFSDLLPTGHPFAEVYRDHPNFGNPMTVTVMIQRKDGDIYNHETLDKVWQFTRDIDLSPGVDHDTILSIATEKARYYEATPYGIDIKPLMDDHVPRTHAEIAEFKRRLEGSEVARNFFVSADGTATLVQATFIERLIDYDQAFQFVNNLVQEARDEHHEVYLAGIPAMTGWVYHYQDDMIYLFGLTLTLMVLLLVSYMRNSSGIIVPMFAAILSAVWGFGFVGWLDEPIEPLLLLVPLLLVARAFSHTIQMTERYYEVLANLDGDRKAAGELTMRVMMIPGTLGIITDAAGIFLIGLAPIPAMERFSLFAGFWALMLIPSTQFLVPILLSYLPVPKNVDRLIGKGGESGVHGVIKKSLNGVAGLITGRYALVCAGGAILVAAWAVYGTLQVKIGNPVEGSGLLHYESEYNEAVRQINRNFPGVNTLEIVLEGKAESGDIRAAKQAEAVKTMLALQYILENGPNPPRATLSFADYMMEGNRLYSGGSPEWLPLDYNNRATNAAAAAVLMGTNPKVYSHVTDFEFRNATVSLWYKDNKQETVDAALAAARNAVEQVGVDHEEFTVRLGTGTIALQQAMNDTVEKYHYRILGVLNLVILAVAAVAYRSLIAGIILLLPVNLSNAVISATMHILGVGLDINTLMVAAIGVGIGIDYGIYLLSRICEEFDHHDGNFEATIAAALSTTGKAITFTALIMLLAIAPWYFLSELKFMADMGLLLSVTMLVNMIMALGLLPMLVWWIKPKFVSNKDLLVRETVDYSGFLAEKEAREAGDDGKLAAEPA